MTETTKVHRYESTEPDAWTDFLAAMHSGEEFECDEEMYYYWLEVLPPVYMSRVVRLPNGALVHANFGFAKGAERITAFWRKGNRHFGCRTKEINRV